MKSKKITSPCDDWIYSCSFNRGDLQAVVFLPDFFKIPMEFRVVLLKNGKEIEEIRVPMGRKPSVVPHREDSAALKRHILQKLGCFKKEDKKC